MSEIEDKLLQKKHSREESKKDPEEFQSKEEKNSEHIQKENKEIISDIQFGRKQSLLLLKLGKKNSNWTEIQKSFPGYSEEFLKEYYNHLFKYGNNWNKISKEEKWIFFFKLNDPNPNISELISLLPGRSLIFINDWIKIFKEKKPKFIQKIFEEETKGKSEEEIAQYKKEKIEECYQIILKNALEFKEIRDKQTELKKENKRIKKKRGRKPGWKKDNLSKLTNPSLEKKKIQEYFCEEDMKSQSKVIIQPADDFYKIEEVKEMKKENKFKSPKKIKIKKEEKASLPPNENKSVILFEGLRNIREGIKEEEEKVIVPKCLVCKNKERDVIFLPCMDIKCCKECGKYFRICPICNQEVKEIKEFHF